MPESKYFKNHELACKCCGENKMDPQFLAWLDQVRAEFGKPMRLSSAYRCPTHNARVSSTGPAGPHTTGKAVDVLVSGQHAHALLKVAFAHGVSGVGVKQTGPHETRFIHLDMITSHPRPWCWSY